MVYELSFQEVDLGDGRWENDEFDVATASDVTINIKGSGTDSATVRYLNLERRAKTVVIRPGATISIKAINGKTAKVPITIVTDKVFSMTKGLMWDNFVITTESSDTNVKILVT